MPRTSFNIKVRGTKSTIDYLEEKQNDVEEGMNNCISEGKDILKEEVKASINGERAEPRSVDTGNFYRSVETRTENNSGVVFSEVSYAKYLEFGTSSIPARRHFQNSLNRVIGDIKNIVEKNI